MRIGFDAKRAFHNFTGLGNYSRTLIHSLANQYPQNEYLLFNPKPSSKYKIQLKNCTEVLPNGIWKGPLAGLWRSRWMVNDIRKKVDLYHGLSHELPNGIEQIGLPKVVTMHDLIFEHYPQYYRKSDVYIYRQKFHYACRAANKVVAISEATKQDLIHLYKVPENKIEVCYQACSDSYFTSATENQKELIAKKYKLPKMYWLCVGSIIERKNLLRVVEAYHNLEQFDIPLVVIGKGGEYKKRIQQFIVHKNIQQHIIFLEDSFSSEEISQHLPALYQMALAVLYPSLMEGFGLPVVEAMASGTAVITSNTSSMKEIGSEATLQVNPLSVEEITLAMKEVMHNDTLRDSLQHKGRNTALQFSSERTAQHMINLYQTLL